MKSAYRLIASMGIAALCACTSFASAPPVLSPGSSVAQIGNPQRDDLQALVVRIRVPRPRHRAHYISQATKGATLVFSGPTTDKAAIGLNPGTNAITVRLAAGNYVGSISAYDAAPVGGSIPITAKLLSAVKHIPFEIARGKPNSLSFTLDGVPASITVGGFPAGAVGSAFSHQSFSIHALDADGYLIVGTYATPIVLVDTDTSGATSIATSGSDGPPADELLGSSDTATISYNGHATAPVTIDASAGSATGFGIFSVASPLIVTNDLDVVSKISPSCHDASCAQALGGGFSETAGVAADANGNVFVANPASGNVSKIPAGCTNSSCVVMIGGGFSLPFGIAVDASDNVYVADKNNSLVKQIPNGCASSSCVNVLGGGFSFPIGVGIDGSGNVFVGDTGHNEVKKIPAGCTNSGCVVTLGGGFDGPEGVVPDTDGGVYVADSIDHAVKYIPSGCATAVCVTAIGGGFSSPTGVAYDGSSVFVADYANQVVAKMPPGCASAACVSTVVSGLTSPYEIAIP